MDLHLVLCLTKPRVTYNEDVLAKDAGECAICWRSWSRETPSLACPASASTT
ncbi:hypothetical protein FQN60_011540, partial [Etheostoma spectabile]